MRKTNVYQLDERMARQLNVDDTAGCLRACVHLKRSHPWLKVILSIHIDSKNNAAFAQVAHCPSKRGNFARKAMDLVDQWSLDGIDSKKPNHSLFKVTKIFLVNWEHPSTTEQGNDYCQLLMNLRQFLFRPRYVLTSAFPAATWALQHINVTQASYFLDVINLMAYDFSGPWTSTSGHHAQLHTPSNPHNFAACTSCASAVQYLMDRNVPSRKILLGIPAYGRSFLGANDVGQKYEGHGGHEGAYEYWKLPLRGSVEHVDEKVGAAYCVGGDGGFVSYDNSKTVRMKAKFAKEMGLAGLFYWNAFGDRKGQKGLITEGYKALNGE